MNAQRLLPEGRRGSDGAASGASGALRLERIHPTDEEWERLDALPGRALFQTRAWVQFVAASQGGEPVVAAVLRDGETVGYFTGLVARRYGVRMLGSPLPGWTTSSMGFTLTGEVSHADVVEALWRFSWQELRCLHVELSDRNLQEDQLDGFETTTGRTFLLPLGTDEAIFAAFSSAARRAVRKAEKVGVVVEEAHGPDFADEYHEQLVGVFARQGLTPTYDAERVRTLISCVEPTGRLLLLRARNPQGESIATAIFPGFGDTAYFWGGASLRDQQILRPNEALFWYAMRHWRDRGITQFDFGGGGDYKRRYGGTEVELPAFHRSRLPGLSTARPLVRILVAQRQRWRARGRRPEGSYTLEE
jgi:CelD/BcsL family acetyltransferase involved in cellulose biosynthesis